MIHILIRDIEKKLDDNYLIGNIFNYFNVYKYMFEKGPLTELKSKHNYNRCMRQLEQYSYYNTIGYPFLFILSPVCSNAFSK